MPIIDNKTLVRLKIRTGRNYNLGADLQEDYTEFLLDGWTVEQYAYGNIDLFTFTVRSTEDTGVSYNDRVLNDSKLSNKKVELELWDTDAKAGSYVKKLFGGTIVYVSGYSYNGLAVQYECKAMGWVYDLENTAITAYYEFVSDRLMLLGTDAAESANPPLTDSRDSNGRAVDALHEHVHDRTVPIKVRAENLDLGIGNVGIFHIGEVSYRQVLDQLTNETENIWRVDADYVLYYHRRNKYRSGVKLGDEYFDRAIMTTNGVGTGNVSEEDANTFLMWESSGSTRLTWDTQEGFVDISVDASSLSRFRSAHWPWLYRSVVLDFGRNFLVEVWNSEIETRNSNRTLRVRDKRITSSTSVANKSIRASNATYTNFKRTVDTSKLKNHIIVIGGVDVTESVYDEPVEAGKREFVIGDWSALPLERMTAQESEIWRNLLIVRLKNRSSGAFTNQRVRISGTDDGAYDVTWNFRDGTLTFKNPVPANTNLYVKGIRRTPYSVSVHDPSSESRYGRTSSLVVKDVSLVTADAVRRRGEAELKKWNHDLDKITLETENYGFNVGERVSVRNKVHGITEPDRFDDAHSLELSSIPSSMRNYVIDSIVISDLGGNKLLYELSLQSYYLGQAYDRHGIVGAAY